MTPFQHQLSTIEFISLANGRCFVASDPGTGKTASILWWFLGQKAVDKRARLLVLCPKSIMTPAWLADVRKFTPTLRAAVATGTENKKLATLMDMSLDIVISNHYTAKQLPVEVAERFTGCVVDESTAFKNGEAKMTKSLLVTADKAKWKWRIGMSGTPTPQSILDLWAQLKFVRPDKVPMFREFRNQTCFPQSIYVGKVQRMIWTERPNIRPALIAFYSDTIIRFAREDCIDLPPQTFRTMGVDISPALRKHYNEMKTHAMLELGDSKITAVHAGALATKLLQVASGFVYDSDKEHHCLSEERYELIVELIAEREHTLVAFNYKAQRDYLKKLLTDAKISFTVIDGDTPLNERNTIEQEFQAGKYQALLCHPKSTGHGLTLTKADTIIWAGATANTEHFEQFNARNYRIGQTKPVEVIMIEANGTYEVKLYERLAGKRDRQLDLLSALKEDISG